MRPPPLSPSMPADGCPLPTMTLKLPPAYRLIERDAVGSSNEEAKALARAGAEDGTLLWVREQAAGKGRGGRAWESPPGNLYISLILRPDCPLGEASALGFIAALAVGEAIGSVAPPMDVLYKWPNDVLLNGRKVAGILLESETSGEELSWLVLGVGVNVAHFPKDANFPATSLHFDGAPKTLTVEALLQAFCRYFLSWTNRWLEEGFAPVRAAWLRHAYRKGEEIEARLPQETLRGRFLDIDEDGCLLLLLLDGSERRIAYGEVFPPDRAGEAG